MAIGSVNASEHEACDAETQVSLSMLYALQHNYMLKESAISDLEKTLVETAELLSITYQQAEEVHALIQNMTTEALEELEVSKICDYNIASDCCKVIYMIAYNVTKIIESPTI